MSLDDSFARAKALCDELEPRLNQIETEQDARFQIINRMMTEVLAWDFGDIKTEPHGETGYTDYLVSSAGQKCLVIEAKRLGPLLIDTLNPQMRTYKVGGPALASAGAGIRQAIGYCIDHGVNYAIVTTGVVWIVFLPLPGGGVSFREGVAFVFPNFKAILENFATFYDLASKESVTAKNYNLQFAKAGGLSIAEFEPLSTANRVELVRMLPQSPLAIDLDPVFREFFGSLSGEGDRDMLLECFVETRESRFADASLEKMVRSVSASITEIDFSSDSKLAQDVQAAVESGRGETVVLVGNNGAGKSTFIERFFEFVLEQSVRSKCLVVRVDLLEAIGDVGSAGAWLTSQIKQQLEQLLFDGGHPTFEDLQGLYWPEYRRWMTGQFKPLYESDKLAFKLKFGEYLNEQTERDPYSFVVRLLWDIVKNRKLLPCLIFDNGDHFDGKFQEAVFQYSQALHKTVPFTFVVMPITDRSFWRLSKAGPFQTYASKTFYLPVPPTKDVLEKRVEFLKRKIAESGEQRQYFSARGIRLTLENINGFAACLEEIFIREDFVSRRISWLANNNLSRSLSLTQGVILSPFFSIDDLVTAYVVHGSGAPLKLNYRKFMQALLQGNYNAFQQEHNHFVLNVFAISPYFPTTPLLNLSILKVLIDRAGEGGVVGSYMSVEQVRQYFGSAGVSEPAIDHAIGVLLSYRLIEPYDASNEAVETTQRVAITHSGRIHYELSMTDSFFISDMALATPVRGMSVVDSLRAIKSEKMAAAEWQAVQRIFVGYCLEQDDLYVRLPKDPMYEGQRLLRSGLKSKWVEQRSSQERGAGYSHLQAVVKWFNSDRGFGIVEGEGEEIFLHGSVLQRAELPPVEPGDTIECDVALGPKGRLQVITAYSVQAAPIDAASATFHEPVQGIVDFYNRRRGYGFIHADTLPSDIYVSGRVLDECGVEVLAAGDTVSVSIQPSHLGRGFIATTLKVISRQVGLTAPYG